MEKYFVKYVGPGEYINTCIANGANLIYALATGVVLVMQ